MNKLQRIKHETGNITNGLQAEINNLRIRLNKLDNSETIFSLDLTITDRPESRKIKDVIESIDQKINRLRDFLHSELKDVK